MTIHRTLIPRTVGVAAAAALFAGLASTTLAVVETASTSAPVDESLPPLAAARYADVIALRPDPANLSQLVVDFGQDGFGR